MCAQQRLEETKALAAFDRELTHYKQEIPDSRNHCIHCPSLVWTADRRPHPAVTGTLQYAGDIASSRNGQQMSAKSLQHRWKTRNSDCLPSPESSHDGRQSNRILQHEQNPSSPVSQRELSITGAMLHPLDGGKRR